MENTPQPPRSDLIPVHIAARALRVPARWLRAEVESGRLPGLLADHAVLVHRPTIAAILAERAKAMPTDGEAGGAR